MAFFPNTPAELAEKVAALQLAVTGLTAEMMRAQEEGKLAKDSPFAQNVAAVASNAAIVLASTTDYSSISSQLDSLLAQINQLGNGLAAVTGRPSTTGKYLDKYESSPFTTILCLAVVGVGGYYLYRWATRSDEAYPRHKLPRYAGGYRRY